ncbi:hypothetical protein MKW92_018458 [Papaver armeniacum]|nr:hypothetical protein MKW92_018458 [Papaver armeniacum]
MEGSSSSRGMRKGAYWSAEEDLLLRKCIQKYGEGKWHRVPLRAGLDRCRKSCRLRWLNYLRPDIKRGEFKSDEVDLIIRMHKLLGNRQAIPIPKLKLFLDIMISCFKVLRWSLIAGRIPGRTANDVKNFYNTHLKKIYFSKHSISSNRHCDNHRGQGVTKCRRHRFNSSTADDNRARMVKNVVRPVPRNFSDRSKWIIHKASTPTGASSSITDNNSNNALLDFGNTAGFDVEEGKKLKNEIGTSSDSQVAEEGGKIEHNDINDDHSWNELYLGDNLWRIFMEDQDGHSII